MTDEPRGGVTLVALLYLHPGRGTDFGRFEAAASRIMARYGGRIERRIQSSREGDARSAAKISPMPSR